ncbi:MAG TPA: leucine/isoleucine/valine transporter permease subunit [Acidimicrobiia bacterium]
MATSTKPSIESAGEAARPNRPASRIDWRKTAKLGFIGGLTTVFIVAIGMLEAFDRRILIAPILSLGYLAVGWVPFGSGYMASKQDVVEGAIDSQSAISKLLAGALTGGITALFLWLLAVAVDAWDMRGIFVKLSPGVVELLTFGRGLGSALAILVGGSLLLGALGGGASMLSERARRGLFGALSWVFVVAILQVVVNDLNGWFRTHLYDINGGLTVPGAMVVAGGAGFVAYRFAGAVGRTRARLHSGEATVPSRYRIVLGVVLVVLALALPAFLGTIVNELLANVGLFLLMGLGLNIVVGYAGLLDLGYVAFFAVGAYTTAVLTSPISPRFKPMLTVDFLAAGGWIVLGVVVLAAIVAGILVGTPVIRMRGDYLAIVTLGFGEIVRILFLSDWLSPTFGGAQGVRQIPAAKLDVLDVTITGINPKSIFYIVMVFVAIAIYVSWRLSKSRIGRAWAAMREDESVAAAMGIDTVRAKLLAFVAGAILASFGGMIFAIKVGSVFPNSFELLVSIIVLVVVIVGGMGNIPGVIVGALVLIGVLGGPTQPGVLAEFAEFKLLIYGAILVYMMLQRPEGLLPSVRRSRELHQEEFLQDAWIVSTQVADETAEATR